MEIIEEIKGIIRAEIEKAIAGIQFPEKFDLELLNSPEIKVEMPPIDLSGLENALLKAVEARKIDIPAPDFTRLENLIQSLIDDLKIPDNTDILQALIKAVNENKPLPMDFSVLSNSFKDLSDKIEKNTGYKGGAIGPSKIWIRNSSGTVVNPATEDKQDTIIANQTNSNQRAGIFASDSPSIDAFGRWRVSNPQTLFDSKNIFDDADIANTAEQQPLLYDNVETSGGGTATAYNANQASQTLSVSATTAGTRVRQTKMRFNYQPGKSQLILMTFNLDGTASGITKREGIFDENNGLFLEALGTTISFVNRTKSSGSVVDNKVAQASWNLDTMDGNGASGITLDWSKTHIMFIDFEWLGVGRVRMGFVVDGVIYYAHEFLNANVLSVVYMSTPNLPLRSEISNDGTGVANTITQICSSVISEGGSQDLGITRYKSTAGTHVDADTENTIYAVVGIKLKPAYLGATIKILNAAIQLHTNSKVEWILLLNPTVGGTFTYSNLTSSAVQVATGASTNTVTGGTEITGGYVESGAAGSAAGGSATNVIDSALRLGATVAGTLDSIVLCVRPIAGSTNVDVEGSLIWRELL